MQFRLFSIPATGDVEGEASLNTFVRSRLEPRESRRQLEQRREELPVGVPE